MGNYYDSNVYVNTVTVYNNGQGTNLIREMPSTIDSLRKVKLRIPTLAGLGIDLSEFTQRHTGTPQNPNWQPQWVKIITPENKFDFKSTPFSILGVFPSTSSTGAAIGMGFTQPEIWVGANAKTNYFSSQSDIVGGDSSLIASSTAFGSVKLRSTRRIIPTGYQFTVIDDSSIGLVRYDKIGFFTEALFDNYYPVILEGWEPNSDNPSDGYNYLNFLSAHSNQSPENTYMNNYQLIITNMNSISNNTKYLGMINSTYSGKYNSGFCDTAFSAGVSGDTTNMTGAGFSTGQFYQARYSPLHIPLQDPDTLNMSYQVLSSYIARPADNALDGSVDWTYNTQAFTTSQQYCLSPWTFVWDEDNDEWYILSFNYFLDSNMNKACYLELQKISDVSSGTYTQYLTKLFNLQEPEPGPGPGPEPIPDPYEDIVEEETGGGEGSFDWEGDPMPADTANVPEVLPEGTDIHTYADDPSTLAPGLLNAYRIDKTNEEHEPYPGGRTRLQQCLLYLYRALWSSGLATAVRNSNTDVKNCIVSLNMLPYEVPYRTDHDVVVVMGGDACYPYGTVAPPLGAPAVTNPITRIDLGSCTVGKFYDGYLDYAPYCEASIYLPYIGMQNLDINEIMGNTISVYYECDNVTGLAVAHVLITRENPQTGDTETIDAYNYQCNLATTIPISGAQYTQKLSALLQTVGGAVSTGVGIATENPIAIASGVAQIASGISAGQQRQIYRSNLSGNFGNMAIKYPFLVIRSPRLARPQNRLGVIGQRSHQLQKVGDCVGYTEFEKIHLESLHATKEEKELLEQMLTGGVIL